MKTKTKEFTTSKGWKCDLNYLKMWWTLLWISPRTIFGVISYIEHFKESIIWFPNSSKLAWKNKKQKQEEEKQQQLGCCFFSTHFLAFGTGMKYSCSCLICYFKSGWRIDSYGTALDLIKQSQKKLHNMDTLIIYIIHILPSLVLSGLKINQSCSGSNKLWKPFLLCSVWVS